MGLGAGGSAGKASEPGPRTFRGGPRDAGREVGGVGRAEFGFEEGVGYAVEALIQGVPPRRGVGFGPALFTVGRGKPGKLLADDADAEPQDWVRDAEEREDCAVEDLSFRTRAVLFGGAGAIDGMFEVT